MVLILISDVLHTEASCMTFLTAIHFLMILYAYITHWGGWLRHCCTSRKVMDVTSDGVIGLFHWLSPSVRTMAVWLALPLIEMFTRDIWGVCVCV
jgi:hypothetical protein